MRVRGADNTAIDFFSNKILLKLPKFIGFYSCVGKKNLYLQCFDKDIKGLKLQLCADAVMLTTIEINVNYGKLCYGFSWMLFHIKQFH